MNMSQFQKAEYFASLHVAGNPLLLQNAWDAGSAKAIAGAGGKAIATSSWAVAAAHGYEDGEAIPLELAQMIVGRIAATTDLPVTVDVEGGYSDEDPVLAGNISRFLDAGVVGINFEDRIVAGTGLYGVERQAARIAAIRAMTTARAIPLFINARTDLFLGTDGGHASLMDEAKRRADAYAAAGASGFFVPGLSDDGLIAEICAASTLPINVMVMDGVSPADRLAALGVARISYGPIPYMETMAGLASAVRDELSPSAKAAA
ncbi:isocitrate lyase/PEP mutase family protein [Sphingopyxis indica]|uniref:2-Methylisocitrate lyase, PEP mutase family n=1 Tax=Sphingopyxis indica TaxID=436663 RepID=A0A239HCL4_9SPHN|nr:isocitrate lyase/phosphoenolpyruvate mutase family protein [Sphingopyxis indica]SNS78543.1 2-Methylisocitrate lyase, PEP mutase family [Sphingopyxis indica]